MGGAVVEGGGVTWDSYLDGILALTPRPWHSHRIKLLTLYTREAIRKPRDDLRQLHMHAYVECRHVTTLDSGHAKSLITLIPPSFQSTVSKHPLRIQAPDLCTRSLAIKDKLGYQLPRARTILDAPAAMPRSKQ